MDNEPSLPHSSTPLVLRRKNRSDANDIQSTIARLETLVNLQDVPPSDEYQNLSTLGVAYMDRYMSQQDSQDILRAIDCWERANRMSSIQQEVGISSISYLLYDIDDLPSPPRYYSS